MSTEPKQPLPIAPGLNDWGNEQKGNDMGLAPQTGPADVAGAGVPAHTGERPFGMEEGDPNQPAAAPDDTAALNALADEVSGKNQSAPPSLAEDADAVVQLDTRPMPEIGHPVVFYPRPGDGRAGRLKFPATVMARDTAKRTLDIMVTYDRDDFVTLVRIPERAPGEAGWEMISALPDKATAFKVAELTRIVKEQSETLSLLGEQAMALHKRLQYYENKDLRAAVADKKPKAEKKPKAKKPRKKG